MITAVVLAGGKSRRMGQPKLLLEHRGKTLLANAIQRASCVTNQVLTIVGDGSDASFDLTHNWTTRMVKVEILDYGNNGSGATYATVHADVTRPNDDYVTVTFAVAPAATQDYKVLLHKITA